MGNPEHMHYVAFSRVKTLEDLYILNMNEDTMAINNEVNTHRSCFRALLCSAV